MLKKSLLAATCLALAFGTSTSMLALDDRNLDLRTGLEHVVLLLDATTDGTSPGVAWSVDEGSASVRDAGSLENNHSFRDHSDQSRFPGYNDCDSWQNIVFDGWQATYRLSASVPDAAAAERLIASITTYWTDAGFQPTVTGPNGQAGWTTVVVDRDFATYMLRLSPDSGRAILQGTTTCLPPD